MKRKPEPGIQEKQKYLEKLKEVEKEVVRLRGEVLKEFKTP